jgi:5'-deoxynucleotidase YfbR-like HD superfamily hydrolase
LASIDWDEYKEFKRFAVKEDKLAVLVDFLKSYYNATNAREMFELMQGDHIAEMLLERKDISSAEALEDFIFKS